MAIKRVLAFSSSRVKDSGYLEMAVPVIRDFLGADRLKIAFIPFADASDNYENYLAKTREALSDSPYEITVVRPERARSDIEQAAVIMVGGGNTFKLLHDLYQYELIEVIQQKIIAGTPYIGWSAGSNIAGLTIGTTNDMPIIQLKSFKALGFFPFQINPHYINVKPEGHNGETRDERLIEYLMINPQASIVGLPEGTALQLEGETVKLQGQTAAVLLRLDLHSGVDRTFIHPGTDISVLM